MAVSDEIRRSYAPRGELRVALNFGNRVLVGRDATGAPVGISVDLARTLADALGLDLKLVEFDRAVDVSKAAEQNLWDVCFLAVDPERGKVISFTEPYVRIAGSYLVSAATDAADSGEVVAKDLRIGVVDGSAYTLHLSRQPGAENLTVYPDIFAALAGLDTGEVDGIAGIQQAMQGEADLRSGARVLQPPFMEIRQAMGTPASRPAASDHLRGWLADLARSGGVGGILERHGVSAACAVVP
jgi:polar amino acid transport system substrate-binding protein